MRSIDPNLLTLDISFDFCSIDIKNIIHHCGINIDKKNFKECNKQFCSLIKKKILMIGKKSYSNTAVVFVLLGFYFFLVF